MEKKKEIALHRCEICNKFHEDDITVESEIQKEKDNETIKAFHQLIKGKKEKLVSKAITLWRLQK